MSDTRDVFFRPDELAREQLTLPATLYNQCRLLLSRCNYEHCFVPVRSLQIQAVIDRDEVIFVDSQAYAVRDGEGGKVIKLAWMFCHDQRGDDLNAPAPIELVHYAKDAREIHRRLVVEFRKALDLIEQRQQKNTGGTGSKRVLPFSRD